MDKKQLLDKLNKFAIEIEDLPDNSLKSVVKINRELADKFNEFVQEVEDDYLEKEGE